MKEVLYAVVALNAIALLSGLALWAFSRWFERTCAEKEKREARAHALTAGDFDDSFWNHQERT